MQVTVPAPSGHGARTVRSRCPHRQVTVPAPSGHRAHETSRFAHETSRFAHKTSRSAHETSRSAHETSRFARETSRSARETSRFAPTPSGSPSPHLFSESQSLTTPSLQPPPPGIGSRAEADEGSEMSEEQRAEGQGLPFMFPPRKRTVPPSKLCLSGVCFLGKIPIYEHHLGIRSGQGKHWRGNRKGALSSALLRAKRSLEVTAVATSNVLFLALGNAAGLDLPLV